MESYENEDRTGLEIAVIGMACRFPGAASPRELWEQLEKGTECITFYSKEELGTRGVAPELYNHPDYVPAGINLENKDCFDAGFFGYTPTEVRVMDPQTRILHECAWEALEDAAYDPGVYGEMIGFYIGAASNFNWEVLTRLTGRGSFFGESQSSVYSNRDNISTHISYRLDLKGPSFSLNTACSTSLAAIDLACRGLLTGQCSMAIAGGIKVSSQQDSGYIYREDMILSPDGRCRAFDAEARGTIGGEGAGLVVLKPLEDAIEDRDHIEAVIIGTAVNNDGNRKVGYKAPSIKGQADVITAAHHMAEIDPETIAYIETHGTATPLGDSIEIQALTEAFDTNKKHFCPLGAIKTNMGHMDTAAGVAGFIKTVLVLKNRMVPPSLNFNTPNRQIDFENSPFYVNTTLSPLKSPQRGVPLRAGVSAFGIGGTNAHIVLEEAPAVNKTANEGDKYHSRLILLSAGNEAALDRMSRNLARHLEQHPEIPVHDTAYTLQVGRKGFNCRRMAQVTERSQIIETLGGNNPGAARVFTHAPAYDGRPVVFVFSGPGSGYVDMGRDLYRCLPVFREEMDRCFQIFFDLTGTSMKEMIYPSQPVDPGTAANRLNSPGILQPLLFSFQYSLARVLTEWGISPSAVTGYGFGEYAAACIASVFSLEDALRLMVRQDVSETALQPPEIPFVSSVTGTWIRDDECADPAYWCSQPTGDVRFDDGIRLLLEEDRAVFIEIGTGRDLSGIINRDTGNPSEHPVLELVRPGEKSAGDDGDLQGDLQGDLHYLLDKLGWLWLYGVTVDWNAFHEDNHKDNQRYRVSLPTYPFESKPFPVQVNLNLLIEALGQNSGVIPKPTEPGAPEPEPGTAPARYIPPSGELEKIIENAWKEVLDVKEVGVETNFFDLGGNSIDLAKVGTILKEKTGLDVPVVTLLRFPTVRALAQYMEKLDIKTGGTAVPETPQINDRKEEKKEGMSRLKDLRKRKRG